jgi:predicted DNA-binding transcriptional regulator YafY
MRRADRLFRLVGFLQRRRTVTAATLAERLEVSERTVYRDVADLIGSGVPIQGEAGMGYRLERGFDLPPLMFNEAEIEAIVLGARIVKAFADPGLATAADDVLAKIRRVLPDKLAPSLDETPLYGYHFRRQSRVPEHLGRLREALRRSRKVSLGYTDGKKDGTTRIVRPLGLSFIGHAWLLTGWCELRDGFRNFRLDRVTSVAITPESFAPEVGKRFEDFLELMAREPGEPPEGATG